MVDQGEGAKMQGKRKALPPLPPALLCPFMWSEIIPQTRDGPADVWKPCLTVLGMGVGGICLASPKSAASGPPYCCYIPG